ncbi:mechanosensitive ion channel [Desulfurococcaceae archaeon MEX13E-LK6-19]|nr:mechanosensitive ion channel [Desulfurococcaceae archaeon MEX13E-LK6-19]
MRGKGALGVVAGKLIVYGILLTLILALIDYFFTGILPLLEGVWESLEIISEYKSYIMVIVILVSGWLIINSISNTLYQLFEQVYGRQGAGAVRSVVKILGIGALLASIAGWIAGGVAGVALGGFIGIVVGFATQQVLGQAIAGLFILLARPYRIGDIIDLEKEKESNVEVVDITTLFTILKRANGDIVLVPNNNIINQKIVIHKKNK